MMLTGLVTMLTPFSFAGEPAEIAPLGDKITSADHVFVAVATHMTWMQNGKPLKHIPLTYGFNDEVKIDLDVSEVFIPDSWEGKHHVTITLTPSRRGDPSLVSVLLGKRAIYLLNEIGGKYYPAADGTQPAVSMDMREKVLEELVKKGKVKG